MSIYGTYLLIDRFGRVIRKSPVPMKPWPKLSQKLAYFSGDVFLDHPLPSQLIHLHEGEGYYMEIQLENVSKDGIEKYCCNFMVISTPDKTPELVDALEHFLIGAYDLLNVKETTNGYLNLFESIMEAAEPGKEEYRKEHKKKLLKSLAEKGDFGKFLAEMLDGFGEGDPMENLFSGLSGRRNPMGDPFSTPDGRRGSLSDLFSGHFGHDDDSEEKDDDNGAS